MTQICVIMESQEVKISTISAVTHAPKQRRAPARFTVAKTYVTGPAPDLPRDPVTIDTTDQTPRARAVFEARPGTCRFPIGEGADDFAYCGAPATVTAGGGVATYCGACARRMYLPRERPAAQPGRSAANRNLFAK